MIMESSIGLEIDDVHCERSVRTAAGRFDCCEEGCLESFRRRCELRLVLTCRGRIFCSDVIV